MKTITFKKWLKLQEHRDDPVGDLAGDAARDKRRTPGNTLGSWRWHLKYANAHPEALKALEKAWEEYEIEKQMI